MFQQSENMVQKYICPREIPRKSCSCPRFDWWYITFPLSTKGKVKFKYCKLAQIELNSFYMILYQKIASYYKAECFDCLFNDYHHLLHHLSWTFKGADIIVRNLFILLKKVKYFRYTSISNCQSPKF